ncbi:MAG: farnesyl-diphosphate synthase [Gemmataceae bacterium]
MATEDAHSRNSLSALWQAYQHSVDQRLARYLDAQADRTPARLLDAMRYSLLAPGKRLRPLLVLLVAEALGGQVQAALPAACAVEMVHCYSLIHDDLPAMDDDDVRRGRPACHRQFDEATAILTGDALLTLAFEILGHDVHPPEVATRCVVELAQAAGPAGMVGGQMDDLLAQGKPGNLPGLESLHWRKTGLLLRASLRLGFWVASPRLAPDEQTRWLALVDDYAASFGLAFQIADDLLDVQGDVERVGKPLRRDAARGKLTFPGLVGISASRARLAELCRRAAQIAARAGPRAEPLAALATFLAQYGGIAPLASDAQSP